MAAKTVLIADDDRALVQALAVRCRQLGLEVDTVPDGMQAYDAITARPPNLLILDVQMPTVSGLYLCDELARDTKLAPIPTIILTGNSDQDTMQKCERLGAHHVWKGLDAWDRLKPLMCELLDLHADADQVPAPASAEADLEEEQALRPGAPTVLVIDDDPDLSKAIKLRLRPYGVEVLRAFNGMQGYWRALKDRPGRDRVRLHHARWIRQLAPRPPEGTQRHAGHPRDIPDWPEDRSPAGLSARTLSDCPGCRGLSDQAAGLRCPAERAEAARQPAESRDPGGAGLTAADGPHRR